MDVPVAPLPTHGHRLASVFSLSAVLTFPLQHWSHDYIVIIDLTRQ